MGLWQWGQRIRNPSAVGVGVPRAAAAPSPPGEAPVGGGKGMVSGEGPSAAPATRVPQTGQRSGELGSAPGEERMSHWCPRGQVRLTGAMAAFSGKSGVFDYRAPPPPRKGVKSVRG